MVSINIIDIICIVGQTFLNSVLLYPILFYSFNVSLGIMDNNFRLRCICVYQNDGTSANCWDKTVKVRIKLRNTLTHNHYYK